MGSLALGRTWRYPKQIPSPPMLRAPSMRCPVSSSARDHIHAAARSTASLPRSTAMTPAWRLRGSPSGGTAPWGLHTLSCNLRACLLQVQCVFEQTVKCGCDGWGLATLQVGQRRHCERDLRLSFSSLVSSVAHATLTRNVGKDTPTIPCCAHDHLLKSAALFSACMLATFPSSSKKFAACLGYCT